MREYLLLGLLVALSAHGQEQAIQRELILRQQQSDAFALQLRQSQQLQAIPPGDLQRRTEVEASQRQQRQDLDNLNARQLLEAGRDTPAERQPQERARFDEQRRMLVTPQQVPGR